MLALYKNIKARRLELKMSQDRLAELTGYKDRSSIAKIEKGEVDLAESKIREFAKALKITPQELMGWDDPDTDISIDETFERICEFYNILNPEGKAEALKRISELSQILQYSANHKAVAIPMAIPYGIMAFGCAGIVLESAINIIEFHLGLKKHKKNIEEEM